MSDEPLYGGRGWSVERIEEVRRMGRPVKITTLVHRGKNGPMRRRSSEPLDEPPDWTAIMLRALQLPSEPR